jgi:hypothetical protein
MMTIRAFAIGCCAAIVLVAGCASGASPSTALRSAAVASPAPASSPSPAAGAATASASVASIVGEWHATITCELVVRSLTDAGFASDVPQFLIDGASLPGENNVTAIKDPAKPCKGAIARDHAHVFGSNGAFESLDWRGMQVDGGTYRIIGDDSLFIGDGVVGQPTAQDVTFRFQISGDDLTLTPVIPADCTADPCRGNAFWATTVAMGGMRWHRTP